jgi:hypothetical protein
MDEVSGFAGCLSRLDRAASYLCKDYQRQRHKKNIYHEGHKGHEGDTRHTHVMQVPFDLHCWDAVRSREIEQKTVNCFSVLTLAPLCPKWWATIP